MNRAIETPGGNLCVVIGGSFNPPTLAHAALMRHAMEKTGAAGGIFVPSSDAYVRRKMHKVNETLVWPEKERQWMLMSMMADAGLRNVDVSDCEFGDDGRGHTYDTMEKLKATGQEMTYAFLLGADKLRILPKWRNVKRFLHRFKIIVMSRPGEDAEKAIMSNQVLNANRDAFLLIDAPEDAGDISSTAARAILHAPEPDERELLNLLSPQVARMVLAKK